MLLHSNIPRAVTKTGSLIAQLRCAGLDKNEFFIYLTLTDDRCYWVHLGQRDSSICTLEIKDQTFCERPHNALDTITRTIKQWERMYEYSVVEGEILVDTEDGKRFADHFLSDYPALKTLVRVVRVGQEAPVDSFVMCPVRTSFREWLSQKRYTARPGRICPVSLA